MIEFFSTQLGQIATALVAVIAAIAGIYFKGRSDGGTSRENKITKATKKKQVELDGKYDENKTAFDKIRTDIISEHPDERLR
jgi:hypothetical protein